VPYAMRAAYADSASNSANFDIGDSLVLRDKNGNVRMVLNPNTGEFKMVADDTVWFNLKTNSPAIRQEIAPNGARIIRFYDHDKDGSKYLVTKIEYPNNTRETALFEMVQEPTDGSQFYDVTIFLLYCPNSATTQYSKRITQYLSDVVRNGKTYKKGIHVHEAFYDCDGTFIRFKETAPDGDVSVFENPDNTKTEKFENGEHIIVHTVGKDTFQSKVNPKTGEIRHSKRFVSHVVRMEGAKTVATYNNDSTGKSSSTTVDPDKKSATRKNQDIQFYLPESKQQCFGTDIGNGETLWFYMSNVGFEFNDVIIADGIKSDSFVAEYDGNTRVVIKGDADGNSRTEYYDDLNRAGIWIGWIRYINDMQVTFSSRHKQLVFLTIQNNFVYVSVAAKPIQRVRFTIPWIPPRM
jgi:hypothetical protein